MNEEELIEYFVQYLDNYCTEQVKNTDDFEITVDCNDIENK